MTDGPRPPHWSADQPPPSQQPGWGRPPTAPRPGGGWYDAPKPGVIPLRPLRMSEIFEGSVSTIRLYWKTVLGLTLGVSIVIQAAAAVLDWMFEGRMGEVTDKVKALTEANPPPAPHEIITVLREAAPVFLLNAGVLQLVSFIGMLAVTAVITIVVGRAVIGAPLTPKEAFAEARPRLLRLAVLTIAVALIPLAALAVGLIPFGLAYAFGAPANLLSLLFTVFGLAGAILALHLGIRLTLAGPALMLEKQTIRHSLGRALRLSRGVWWRLLGIQLVVLILTTVVTTVVSLPFEAVGGMLFPSSSAAGSGNALGYYIVTAIGGVVGTLVMYPFSAAVTALLYADLRIRRESLDLDLAAAAGLPPHR